MKPNYTIVTVLQVKWKKKAELNLWSQKLFNYKQKGGSMYMKKYVYI